MTVGPYDHLRFSVLSRLDSEAQRSAWAWIFDHIQSYQTSTPIQPMRPRDGAGKPHPITVYTLEAIDSGSATFPFPLDCQSFNGQTLSHARLDTPKGLGDYLIGQVFTHANRGRYHAFIGGGRFGFHLALRYAARDCTDRGYQCVPLCRGTTITALIVRKGHHTWMLTDPECMSGLSASVLTAHSATLCTTNPDSLAALTNAHHTLCRLNQLSTHHFGASLRPSIGSTAINAAAKSLPSDAWLWRPSALLVTLCRAAGGYRGGYVYGTKYSGPAYQLDVNKMYAWAMSGPLPLRCAPGFRQHGDVVYDGIYVCEVQGPGRYPISLSRFVSDAGGWRRGNWNGERAIAVLASAELAGMQRLGYRVENGFGIQFLRTFDFGGFASTIGAISVQYGRGSVEERFSKALGNAVYGKLGSNPDNTSICYAASQPGAEWLPFCDERGDEVEGVWAKRQVKYNHYQHVDVAATITARARGKLYEAMADTLDAGGQVLAANTDCLIVDKLWRTALDDTGQEVGDWRLEAYDEHAQVAGRNAYSLAGHVAISGVTEPKLADVEVMQRGEALMVGGKRLQTPWLSAEMYRQTLSEIRRATEPDSGGPGPP